MEHFGPQPVREGYVEHHNNIRLNSAVQYITPKDMLAGHQQEIHANTHDATQQGNPVVLVASIGRAAILSFVMQRGCAT